jgi:tetratricopeptide (TPR) repeat protein
MPLILGGVGAVVVIAVIAVVLMKGGGGESGAAELIKEGDSAFAAHDYTKAAEAYDAAAQKGTKSPNLKKAKDEVPAQQAFNEMQKAIASGDFDKAKAAADTCTSDGDRYFAKQCSAKADAIKAGQVKMHLDKAKADPDSCAKEAGLALQIDPASDEAQKVMASCKGAAVAVKQPEPRQVARQDPPPRPAAPAGPSQEERNANAAKAVGEGNAAYGKGDMDAACDAYNQALAQKPKGPTLAGALRGLGTCYSKKGDNAQAVKYFKMYLPLAPATEQAKVKAIIDYYSKQ